MVVLLPGGLFPCMSILPLLTDELLQLSFSDEGFNLLFQIVAIRSIVTVIAVETAILVPGSLGWIALQLPWECQRSASALGLAERSEG